MIPLSVFHIHIGEGTPINLGALALMVILFFYLTESFTLMEAPRNKSRYQFRFSDKVTNLPPSSEIDLRTYHGRLFVDEVFGTMAEVRVTVNGISLKGRWEIETEDVGEFDYILRLVDQPTRSSITLTFTDQESRLRAVENLESNQELQHVRFSPKSVRFESILEKKRPPKRGLVLRRRDWNIFRWIVGRPVLASAER